MPVCPRFNGLMLIPIVALALPRPAFAAPAADSEVDKFFKSIPVLDLAVEIGAKDMDSLRREPRKYVKATLKEGDKVYKDVALHLKGAAGSFRGVDDKPGLTLNTDKFVEGQSFHGLDKFHLNNCVQDPAYIQELFVGELFRAAGVPASRLAHATVSINGKKKGLYALKEGYDKLFLKRNFGTSNGNLYDGGFLRDLDQPLELITGKEDVTEHKDLKALFNAAREPDAKKRYAGMEKLLDVNRFASYLAVEVITCDWDGYPINRNNYRLWHDPAKNKIVFIPSGMDQMFGDLNTRLLPPFQGFIARAFMETPEGRELYLTKMGEILAKVLRPDALDKRLDELEARVKPALAAVDAGAGRDYPNQVKRLRDAVRYREKFLSEQLARIRNPVPRKMIAGGPGLPDDGFLCKWLFLGPIGVPPGEGVKSLNRDFVAGEAKLKPAAGDKVKVARAELAWKVVESPDEMMNIATILGRQSDFSACYLVAYLVVEKDFSNLQLRMGSDDQAKVWLNGTEVLKCEAERPAGPDQDSVGKIALKKGVNPIVFKIVNAGGDWQGCLRFVNPNGTAFTDARLSVNPDGK